MLDTDVLIVGAGPVGLLSALALVQKGVGVTVIEADARLNDSPRAAIYFPSTLCALQELGVLEDLERRGFRNARLGHHVPGLGFRALMTLEVLRGITFDYMVHAGQDVVDEVALEHARRRGARVLFEHCLTGLEQDAGGATARIATPAGERVLRASWVIGADGARSTVRHLLGVDFEGHTWANRFVATNVYCDFPAAGYEPANFICDPVYSGVVALLDREGLWRLTYQEDAALPVETFMERLPERYAHFIPAGMHYQIKAARPYTIHQRCAARLRVGRVCLAGDAAHATNPLGGLGLTTGVWTGLILSDLLGAVIGGEAEAAILDRFSQERRRVFWEVTSPGATENKRMAEEKDLEQRRRDLATVQAAADNPEIARLMMAFPFKVIGDPLRENSRWRGFDPTAPAGIDLSARRSQVG
ncbi:MAG TPA: FAD-dependent monooxygenase [Steroidobacteraceae bacterium]|nr:FAD-dependent monooxygenase [Steroidobacteraceae bacterium]